ncbi:fumarylpyruvate hydrolase [Monaibacterium marinum]|uniref:Fumarylpyruvate hydrolase n=1 Tax=Pontivivens marinum TaxID=1690039 RepID=A0A2C9CTD6_9RHOB|nr:fumarylacetoacetate hydrolase family protein [Monaibacterium marinum]SOH94527.1 fumarylpyruvate hydrolase [Monaibacterium marinum]
MTDFALPTPPISSVAIHDSEQRFAVRRVFCVGRNYAAHAREMGNDERDPPFFFTKPADALVDDSATIPYPPLTEDLHHEAELVVAIGKGGINITVKDAASHIWGYAIGNDLTRRDLQAVAKKAGRPWDWGKAFDSSAICGPIHAGDHPLTGAITSSVNGVERQRGDLADMIWSVPEIIAICSTSVALQAGDLIYTGTPAGVGALSRGDTCTCEIEGLGAITTIIAP